VVADNHPTCAGAGAPKGVGQAASLTRFWRSSTLVRFPISNHVVQSCPGVKDEQMPDVMERELIETRYDWVCSQCGCLFFNRDWVIVAPTLMEMVQHYKKMQKQAFALHVCLSTSENTATTVDRVLQG
jgi:hypothetical protein